MPDSEITKESAHLAATIDTHEGRNPWRILCKAEDKGDAGKASAKKSPTPRLPSRRWKATIPKRRTGARRDRQRSSAAFECPPSPTACGSPPPTANPAPGVADTAFRPSPWRRAKPKTRSPPRAPTPRPPQRPHQPRRRGADSPTTSNRAQTARLDANWTRQVSTIEARGTDRRLRGAQGPRARSHLPLPPRARRQPRKQPKNAVRSGLPVMQRTFTTRTTAEASGPSACPANEAARSAQHSEYLPECRGIELVSKPEKGDRSPPSSAAPSWGRRGKDLWLVDGAAPGAYNPEALLPRHRTRPSERGAAAPRAGNRLAGHAAAVQQLGEGEGRIGRSRRRPTSPVRRPGGLRRVGAAPRRRRIGARPPRRRPEPGTARPLPQRETRSPAIDVSGDGAQVDHLRPRNRTARRRGGRRTGGSGEHNAGRQPRGVRHLSRGSDSSNPMAAPTDRHFQRLAGLLRGEPNKAGERGAKRASRRGLYVRNRECRRNHPDRSGRRLATTAVPRHGLTAAAPTTSATTTAASGARGASPSCEARKKQTRTPTPTSTAGEEGRRRRICLPQLQVGADAKVNDPRVSADLSHLYFESEAALLPDAHAGHKYIYALSGGQLRLVARSDGDDAGGLESALGEAKLAADGEALIFAASAGPRLRADAIAPRRVSASKPYCTQLYRYDDTEEAWSASPACAARKRRTASQRLRRTAKIQALEPTVRRWPSHHRSAAAEDVNRAPDLYEWREGRVGLLSDGRSEFGSRPGTAPNR